MVDKISSAKMESEIKSRQQNTEKVRVRCKMKLNS